MSSARSTPVAERRMKPGDPRHVDLWDAINEYAQACGGKTEQRPNLRRMRAVVDVETALRAILNAEPSR